MGVALRRLSFNVLGHILERTMVLTVAIFFIFIYASTITQFLAATNVAKVLASGVVGLGWPPHAIIAVIILFYLGMGCIINALPMVILTLPVTYPIAMGLGFDPIWFGVIVIMLATTGVLTPPIGMTVFALAAATDVPMYQIFRGVIPFWVLMLVGVVLVVIFPDIALFLPRLM